MGEVSQNGWQVDLSRSVADISLSSTAPWHALRQNDFTVVDFSPLSPALTDLITTCMRADPAERPSISSITQHPVIARARAIGKDALAPESEMFLVNVLTGDMILPPIPAVDSSEDVDVDMHDP